jgi:hypothetical protein
MGRANERYYFDGPPFTFRLFTLSDCFEKAAEYLKNPLPDMPIVAVYYYEDPNNPDSLTYFPFQATCFLLHALDGDSEVDDGADTAYIIM